MTVRIEALVYDGFDELDLVGAFEPLRMAGFSVSLRSLHGEDNVTGTYGLKIATDGALRPEAERGNGEHVLLVPGGGWLTRAPQGAWAEANKGTVLERLRQYHAAGWVLASVCTGSLLLGRAGLLKGLPATTNHAVVEELIGTGAMHVHARVVDSGQIVTAAGITSSLDLAIWLVERFASQEAALEVSARLEHERRGIVWVASSSQLTQP